MLPFDEVAPGRAVIQNALHAISIEAHDFLDRAERLAIAFASEDAVPLHHVACPPQDENDHEGKKICRYGLRLLRDDTVRRWQSKVAAGKDRLSCAMSTKPFFIAKAKSKPLKTAQAIDVAARYFIYKLYEATNGQKGAWQVLREIKEAPATVARAVERGWVIVRYVDSGKSRVQRASLTDEGRRVARKGRA
jgi:hypothetical protein